MKAYDHVYLSPHYDDASLSCGGAIHRQRRAQESVLVVTLCAAAPDASTPVSRLAASFHAWMGSPDDVVAQRMREDRASMERLDADAARLPFTDCIYRGRPRDGVWYYAATRSIFGPVHPADGTLHEDMAGAVSALVPRSTDATIYAPLGIGGHVDHQIAHRAARTLQDRGWTVAFYEDYPYADAASPPPFADEETASPASVPASARRPGLTPRLVRLEEEDLQAKIESVLAYRSQLKMLFGDEASIPARIRAYAMRCGGDQPAERLWIPAPAARTDEPAT